MRLWALLRSRRLAAALLVGMTVYTWVATLVPRGALDSPAVAAWDAEHHLAAGIVGVLGLHRAYTNPAFLAVALVLTASTVACAWERTRAAMRTWRAHGVVSAAMVERLKHPSSAVVEVASSWTGADALDAASTALRQLGMRVRRGPVVVEGSSGAIGLAGSPLFHWALAGLFVFAGLGQATLYEGFANVLVGESITDSADSYPVLLERGPLSMGGFTGVVLTVKKLTPDLVVGGVARGVTPLVEIKRDGTVAKSQWVYSNNPLRYGNLLIHAAKVGRAFVGTVRVAQTGLDQRIVLHYEPGTTTGGRTFGLIDPTTQATVTVEVAPLPGRRAGVTVLGGSRPDTQSVGVGEIATLGEGMTLTVDALTSYAQLKVVNDWSLSFVYAMFILICLAAALTVFVPPRMVRVMVVETSEGARLHAVVTCRKNDPAIRRRVEHALRESMSGDQDPPPHEEDRA